MLDSKDKRLLYALDLDARQPASSIAKNIKLSKESTIYRIKRLQQDGVLQGTGAIIDLAKLGYTVFRVYIKLQKTTFAQKQELIKHLTDQKQVLYVADLEGNRFDISLGFVSSSIYEFELFFQDFQIKFKSRIKYAQTSIFTQVQQFDRSYLIQKNSSRLVLQTLSQTKLEIIDDIDKKILLAVTKDARYSMLELAKSIDVPARTLTYRLKQLEQKKIIVGYKPNINLSGLGMSYYKVDLQLEDVSIIPGLLEFTRLNPNIIYIDKTISGSDFEFDAEVETKEDFFKLMQKLTEQFPQIIDWTYFNSINYKKLEYFF